VPGRCKQSGHFEVTVPATLLTRLQRPLLAAGLALAIPSIGWTAPFSVESPGHAAREEAETLRKAAVQAGASPERTRIVRRYERGAGWRFLVHVDAVPDEAEVQKLLPVLAVAGAAPRVVDLATGEVVAVTAPPPPPPKTPATMATGTESARPSAARRGRREAEGVLRAAVEAHGGAAGGLAAMGDARDVTFQFVREVPVDGKPVVARHVYRRSGDSLRLDVTVQKGTGVDSVTVAGPGGGAWVVSDGKTVPRDAPRTKDIVGRFAPEQLLRVALGVAADIETATAWRELSVVGPEGDDLVVLRPEDGPSGGLVEVAFSRTDHRLRRVTMEGTGRSTVYLFDDYRELAPGLVVPHETETLRNGASVETIQVLGLDATTTIPATLFQPNTQ